MTAVLPGVDAGLLVRFRAAGEKIAWRPAGRLPTVAKGHRARIAHLNDEEARVESWGTDARATIEVDSGPVGALVLLLEAVRRGEPARLGTRQAGEDPAFPNGAIVGVWGGPRAESSALGLSDLVGLARYALA